jgi:hypothetical protein
VTSRDRDEVGEAFERDDIAVVQSCGDRLPQRHDLGHVTPLDGVGSPIAMFARRTHGLYTKHM